MERAVSQSVFDNVSEQILIINVEDYKVVDANRALLEALKLKKEDVVGKTCYEVTHQRSTVCVAPYDVCPISEMLKTGKPVSVEHTHYDKDDNPFYVEVSASPIKDKAGKITHAIHISKNITKTKMEQKKLRTILRTVMDGFWITDMQGRLLEVNDAYCRMTGYSREELLTMRISDVEAAESLEETAKHIQQIMKRGSDRFETRHKRKDGGIIDLEISVNYMKEDNGRLFVFVREITERKRAEEKLHVASLYSRSLIEASLDPLVTISVKGKITDVNKATEFATGCSREELIGSDFSVYFTEPEKAKIGYKKVFIEAFVRDYPLAIRHKSGKITDVLYNAAIYTNEAGEIQGVFAAARDITQLKKAEEQAQEAAKKLKDAERLATIGTTAGMVGHDIRNPLQAIAGDLYLINNDVASLNESEAKESLQESVRSIQGNLIYITKIVEDLQDYAKPLKPNFERIKIEKLIEEVMLLMPVETNHQVVIDIEAGFPDITADFSMLKRAVSNLVQNAVQAMPNDGRLTIQAYRKENRVFITVEDTGVGIPEEVKPKLFTPMVTTKAKGQGLGLAVVKRLVEGLNGKISFESEEGKGTKFIVELPLKN